MEEGLRGGEGGHEPVAGEDLRETWNAKDSRKPVEEMQEERAKKIMFLQGPLQVSEEPVHKGEEL